MFTEVHSEGFLLSYSGILACILPYGLSTFHDIVDNSVATIKEASADYAVVPKAYSSRQCGRFRSMS